MLTPRNHPPRRAEAADLRGVWDGFGLTLMKYILILGGFVLMSLACANYKHRNQILSDQLHYMVTNGPSYQRTITITNTVTVTNIVTYGNMLDKKASDSMFEVGATYGMVAAIKEATNPTGRTLRDILKDAKSEYETNMAILNQH